MDIIELEAKVEEQRKQLKMLNSAIGVQADLLSTSTRGLEGRLDNIMGELKDGDDKKELEKEYFVEKKLNGYRCMGHVDGKSVRLFSDQQKDITKSFPSVVLGLRDSCDIERFIVDGELLAYDSEGRCLGRRALAKYVNKGRGKGEEIKSDELIRFVLFDCLYYDDRCLMDLQEYERKKVLLNNFKGQGESIDIIVPIYVKSRGEMKAAIEEVSKGGIEAEGAIIKAYGGVYSAGKDSQSWIKYRLESELVLTSLGVNEVKGGGDVITHKLGMLLDKEVIKKIDEKYIIEFENKKYLDLGNSFNTTLKGNKLLIAVETCWRHIKDDKYRYSLHKPRVKEVSDKPVSTVRDLEEIVMSIGIAVKNVEEDLIEKDFPVQVQKDFGDVMERDKWMPFVYQWHYRGHRIIEKERKKENIPERYEYKLDSLHGDLRLSVGDHLQGFTILSPTTTDPGDTDDFVKGDVARKGGIRFIVKKKQPIGWLNVKGVYEIGSPGSTPGAPTVFMIVAKGKYKIVKVTDNVIKVMFKCDKGKVGMGPLNSADEKGVLIERKPDSELKDIDGVWQFNWAHIGERYVGLLRLMISDVQNVGDINGGVINSMIELIDGANEKSKRPVDVNVNVLSTIYRLSKDGCFRRKIGESVGLSEKTVYNWQKKMGFY